MQKGASTLTKTIDQKVIKKKKSLQRRWSLTNNWPQANF